MQKIEKLQETRYRVLLRKKLIWKATVSSSPLFQHNQQDIFWVDYENPNTSKNRPNQETQIQLQRNQRLWLGSQQHCWNKALWKEKFGLQLIPATLHHCFYLHRSDKIPSIAPIIKASEQWVGAKLSEERKLWSLAFSQMPPIIMLYCSHTLGYPTSAQLENNVIQDPPFLKTPSLAGYQDKRFPLCMSWVTKVQAKEFGFT